MPAKKGKTTALSQTKSPLSNQLVVFAVIFALIGGAISIMALAARPGTGGSSTATITASPSPAIANGDRVSLFGCGYAVLPATVKVVHSAGYTESFAVGVWSPGCLDGAYFNTKEVGTYTINAYQKSSTKRNATDVLKATTTLQVQ